MRPSAKLYSGGRAYLDHASTSPARPEVVAAMLPWLATVADPGRIHTEGRQARAAVEDARDSVAGFLGARSREVVFTSGATEAIAAAVWGAGERCPHMVLAAVEHSAVREASAGFDITEVPVDRLGRIDLDCLVSAIRPGATSLVHIQLANHEVATLQPVAEAIAAGHDQGVLVHVDAAAAVGHVPVDFAALGADLLSLSAHKFGGPQGIGALLVRRGLRLRPLLVGGDQERARRAGTENVAAIAGFGAAAQLLSADGGAQLDTEAAQALAQTQRCVAAALAVDGVTTYGDQLERVPHVICLGVDGVEAEAVLVSLDRAGVAVHSGSACSSEALEPSPVLLAMGVEAERSLRVSVGWSTTEAEVDRFCDVFSDVVQQLRALRG